MTRRLWLIASFAALAACATGPRVAAPSGAGFELLEPILAVRAAPLGLIVRVRSNGCTARKDFVAYVERQSGAATVAIGRKRVDACTQPAAAPVDLTFTYAELGVDPNTMLFVMNPIAAPPR